MVMAPLCRAARTAALRRATHLLVFGGGRSAISQGCPPVWPSTGRVFTCWLRHHYSPKRDTTTPATGQKRGVFLWLNLVNFDCSYLRRDRPAIRGEQGRSAQRSECLLAADKLQ